MKVIAYLAFTLFSILIQFAVIDYIQANNETNINEKKPDLKETSQRKTFSDVIKEIHSKPHALYYRTGQQKLVQNDLAKNTPTYDNKTVQNLMEDSFTTNVYDLLFYGEVNATTTEVLTTSDLAYTSTESENITELTIFTKANKTKENPVKVTKNFGTKDCYCNLLYQVCDIDCCCDGDCSQNEWAMFNCTEKGTKVTNKQFCPMIYGIETDLFCVAKSNVPEKRNIIFKEHDLQRITRLTEKAVKWHDSQINKDPVAFNFSKYSYGDTIWMLRNGSVHPLELAISKLTNYCDMRTPIKFMKDESAKCIVLLKDLEMVNVLRMVEESTVISVLEMTNSTSLNCSSLHCTKWRIIMCDEVTCKAYVKNEHEASCNDNLICTNIALKLEYHFHINDTVITNATVYLHIQNISTNNPYMLQEINAKFYVGSDRSGDEMIRLSGNPGYIRGLPVIISTAKNNYTKNMLMSRGMTEHVLKYPENKNGNCFLTNITHRVVAFGVNTRSTCRCERAGGDGQGGGGQWLGRPLWVAALGNPAGLGDGDWLALRVEGQAGAGYCGAHVALEFGYAAGGGGGRLVSAVARRRAAAGALVSVSVLFVDVSAPQLVEHAGGPRLPLRLPTDFFFPFPSNESRPARSRPIVLAICAMWVVIPK